MDENLFSLADDFGMPGVMMLEKDGADKKVTTRWKYFRMDPKAFMTMGILKARDMGRHGGDMGEIWGRCT